MLQTGGVDAHGVFRAASFPYFAGFVEYFSKGMLLWIGMVEGSVSDRNWCKNVRQALTRCYNSSALIVPLVSLQVACQLGEGFSVLYLAASLFALIRNLRMPCVAILSRVWFGESKSHSWQQWTLLLGITGGASLAVLCGDSNMTSHTTYGIGIVTALLVVPLSSMKAVLEQSILHAHTLSPLLVSGVQGTLCCMIMVAVLAVVQSLGLENFWDTVSMRRSSPGLTINVCLFGLTCMVDCWFGTMVTYYYDSTVEVTAMSTTVFGIWAVQLGIHTYDKSKGEPWLYSMSLWYLFSMFVTVAIVITFVSLRQPRTQLNN